MLLSADGLMLWLKVTYIENFQYILYSIYQENIIKMDTGFQNLVSTFTILDMKQLMIMIFIMFSA